jgi:hypothetical protein
VFLQDAGGDPTELRIEMTRLDTSVLGDTIAAGGRAMGRLEVQRVAKVLTPATEKEEGHLALSFPEWKSRQELTLGRMDR